MSSTNATRMFSTATVVEATKVVRAWSPISPSAAGRRGGWRAPSVPAPHSWGKGIPTMSFSRFRFCSGGNWTASRPPTSDGWPIRGGEDQAPVLTVPADAPVRQTDPDTREAWWQRVLAIRVTSSPNRSCEAVLTVSGCDQQWERTAPASAARWILVLRPSRDRPTTWSSGFSRWSHSLKAPTACL